MSNKDELDSLWEAIENRAEDEKMIALSEADDIAIEINVIKRRLAQETILAAVEIGRLLCRAKDKVPHGMWGDWLEENVSYSQSTANNMMRLYREYGEQEQLDFFSENRMEIFGNLSQSQAVALLGVPYDKRKEYVETHDMEKTSVREVETDVAAMRAEMEAEKKALREELAGVKEARDDITRELMDTRGKLAEAEAAKEAAVLRALEAETGTNTAGLEKKISDLEKEHGKAAKEWKKERAELERQLDEAKLAAEQVSVDEVLTEEKRAEIEAEISRVYEEKMEALRRDADKRVMAAGNPALVEVNLLFGELQDTYARISGALAGLRVDSPEVADKLTGALKAALKQMLEG